MNYRTGGLCAKEVDGTDEIVLLDDYTKAMDEIEKRVNEALDKIKNITGIDCIEECSEILEHLAQDLY